MRKGVGIAGIALVALLGAAASQSQDGGDSATKESNTLRPLEEFERIDNDQERALALFEEVGKVIQHPRCVNCHPRTERPLQGENGALHQPLVVRGAGGMGVPGMLCTACHGSENYRNVPGNPAWHLAPASMAWEGKSLGEICEQIKDKERNGGKTLAELGEHMANDQLVAYGWNPPDQLEPVPGTQERFGTLFHAWLDAGAACPGT